MSYPSRLLTTAALTSLALIGLSACTPVGPLMQFDNGFGRVPVQLGPAS